MTRRKFMAALGSAVTALCLRKTVKVEAAEWGPSPLLPAFDALKMERRVKVYLGTTTANAKVWDEIPSPSQFEAVASDWSKGRPLGDDQIRIGDDGGMPSAVWSPKGDSGGIGRYEAARMRSAWRGGHFVPDDFSDTRYWMSRIDTTNAPHSVTVTFEYARVDGKLRIVGSTITPAIPCP